MSHNETTIPTSSDDDARGLGVLFTAPIELVPNEQEEMCIDDSPIMEDEGANDEELSEEEDDDFIEDVVGNASTSTAHLTRSSLRVVDDASLVHPDSAVNNEREVPTTRMPSTEAATTSPPSLVSSMPVLLEGDYFPSMPPSVLAELRALDDDDDRGQTTTTQAERYVPRGETNSPVVATAQHQHRSSSLSPAGLLATKEEEVSADERQPSVCSLEETFSPHALRPSLPSVAADSVATKRPCPRKRVRWVDDDHRLSAGGVDAVGKKASRSLVHHASSFTIPGHLPSSASSSIGDGFMRVRRSAAAEQQLRQAPVDIFREVQNADRSSSFFVCRPQRPSATYTTWKQLALRRQGEGEQNGSRLLQQHAPRPFAGFVQDAMSSSSGGGASTDAQGRTPYQLLFKDAPPLFGHVSVAPTERYATRLVVCGWSAKRKYPAKQVEEEGGNASIDDVLDDGGLMVPSMWTSIALSEFSQRCLTPSASPPSVGDNVQDADGVRPRAAPLVDAPLVMPW